MIAKRIYLLEKYKELWKARMMLKSVEVLKDIGLLVMNSANYLGMCSQIGIFKEIKCYCASKMNLQDQVGMMSSVQKTDFHKLTIMISTNDLSYL